MIILLKLDRTLNLAKTLEKVFFFFFLNYGVDFEPIWVYHLENELNYSLMSLPITSSHLKMNTHFSSLNLGLNATKTP